MKHRNIALICSRQFLNGWDYSYSHCKSPTILKPDHSKSDFQKVQISDVSEFQVVGFQIPTILDMLVNFDIRNKMFGTGTHENLNVELCM